MHFDGLACKLMTFTNVHRVTLQAGSNEDGKGGGGIKSNHCNSQWYQNSVYKYNELKKKRAHDRSYNNKIFAKAYWQQKYFVKYS
jgi:hypothetical protein